MHRCSIASRFKVQGSRSLTSPSSLGVRIIFHSTPDLRRSLARKREVGLCSHSTTAEREIEIPNKEEEAYMTHDRREGEKREREEKRRRVRKKTKARRGRKRGRSTGGKRRREIETGRRKKKREREKERRREIALVN